MQQPVESAQAAMISAFQRWLPGLYVSSDASHSTAKLYMCAQYASPNESKLAQVSPASPVPCLCFGLQGVC